MSANTSTIPTVLLVEDSEDDAYFFKRTLQKSGHTCTLYRANDGAEAIQFLQSTATSDSHKLPHVIFLDLKMPVLNGFEVLDWLRQQSFAPQVRVIVLSGSEHQNDKDRAAQLGASDYLVKPVRAGDLNRFLNDICPAVDSKRGANS
jgi:CheY-like chemotaxis protein